jgi:hypothetical protein
MEQAERVSASDGAARSQHLVYTLPHTSEALTQVIAPSLERIDTSMATMQLLIVTPDAETAVTVSELVYQVAGPQGIEVVPVTSANRAARLIEERPVHAVVGSPLELQTLVQRSTLKLADIRTVVLVWADDILAAGVDAVSSMEALFAELPKDANRIFVSRQMNKDLEQLIERYARNARRIAPSGDMSTSSEANQSPLAIQYVTVAATSRFVVLRRLLDDLDPPSAAIVVRTEESSIEARQALHLLGYRRATDPIRVTRDAVEDGTHTVILFDAPVSRGELVKATGNGVVQTIALVTSRQLETLRMLAGSVMPFTLRAAGVAARQHDRLMRDELIEVLSHGVALRELIALEPLLEQYDGIEIAAAAVHLLEQERVQRKTQSATISPSRDETPTERRNKDRPFIDRPRPGAEHRSSEDLTSRPKRDFGERPKRDFGDRSKRSFDDRPKRDFSDRPKRSFDDRPKRDFSDRPKRSFDDRPKRDFSDRPKRSFDDRPKRDFSDRPKRSFDDRPKRDFGDQRKKGFGRGPRER